MKKQVLAVGALLVLGGGMGLPAAAQVPVPTAPVTPTAPAAKVSPEELQKFATVVKQLLTLERTATQDIVTAIEQTGLPKERFLELYLAKRDPAGKPDVKPTPQEASQFTTAETKVAAIQKTIAVQQVAAIKQQGFDEQRFNQILEVVQADPQLQETVRKMLKG
jgi:uncharacterized tellurite resistance protein B-like protein